MGCGAAACMCGVREPAAPPGSAPRPDARLTRGMAEALLEGVGGVPGSLREEPGGEYSFGVSMKPE
ncbi:hypothetical protein ADK70_25210 [Streptomyces rimosus subsp. pseudoverticillatus]|nr:hypothetical protein ADK70_25210 [Streptomyces rimosus subsp. pseudoverticillatus]